MRIYEYGPLNYWSFAVPVTAFVQDTCWVTNDAYMKNTEDDFLGLPVLCLSGIHNQLHKQSIWLAN